MLVFLWIVLRNISLNFYAILQHWQELEITIVKIVVCNIILTSCRNMISCLY